MKTRRSSPRKRCLSEASPPEEAVVSSVATNSNTIENWRSERVRISPFLSPTSRRQQSEENQLHQLPQYNEEHVVVDEVEWLCANLTTHSADVSIRSIAQGKRKMVDPNAIPTTKLPSSQLSNNNVKNCEKHHRENKYISKTFHEVSDINDVTESPSRKGRASAISTSPISSFPYSTSAYLQSLAEISHAVLWDARWRLGDSHQHRLFSWEEGEDMNAIHKLSRKYITSSELAKQRNNHRNIQSDIFTNNKHDAVSSDGRTGNIQNTSGDDSSQEQKNNNLECDPDDRCLETYSRMYFRKGPWFRLDNIYKSYYVPKRQLTPLSTEQADTSTAKDSITPPAKKLVSPSKFFHRRKNKGCQIGNDNMHRNSANHHKTSTTRENDYIDQKSVDLQMEAVVILLEDIKRLFRMGLIRSFLSEEECGKTIGTRREKYDYAAVSLLRQDEQRTVLAKLGGRQNHKIRTASSSNKNAWHASTIAPTPEQQQQPLENLIWKQMCQQQTIFHSFKNATKNTVLPVINHVHKILVEKLASTIIVRASKVEYIPSPVLRAATKVIYDDLFDLTSDAEIASTIMCFRLREAPVRTLRRACRLYLCATSGPGDMRNSGTNAWRSLPDSHTKDLRSIPLRTNVVSPPGSSWNSVRYQGKDWRLRVLSCRFTRSYKPMVVNEFGYGTSVASAIVVDEDGINDNLRYQGLNTTNSMIYDDQRDIQVFSSVKAFHQWEIGVELRENCDFLLELNDLLLYNERKRARESKTRNEKDRTEADQGNVEREINQSSSEDGDTPVTKSEVDFLDLLTIVGRAKIIQGLVAVQKDDCRAIFSKIEQDVSILLGTPFGDRPLSTLVVSMTGESRYFQTSRLENECERILGVIGIILIHILEFRNISIHHPERTRIFKRPWLRHMYWEGCMSYVLWDVIPLLERRGYYEFAINALEVLLFGRRLPRAKNKMIPDSLVLGSENNEGNFFHSYQPLISRRARGKAVDRLIIDYTHFVRRNIHTVDLTENSSGQASTRKKKRISPKSIVNEVVSLFTEPLIRTGAVTGQITFSSIRTLAKRLKRPLSLTLQGIQSFETGELGHRLANDDRQQELTKYNDWTPITDIAVANAMATDRDSIGGRCSFVGFEEDEDAVRIGSLNVEELAKEYYHQGRLPAHDESSTKGGWFGYHDEGGKIRILFRILSSATLGMDWNYSANSILSVSEASTIYLTPYQGAPFDLHVGAEHADSLEVGCEGIYIRRKSCIEKFLGNLSNLDGEDLITFLHDCVNKHVQYTNSLHRPDLTLESDLKQVKTLSMIAVGFGGKMLASIFRCFLFDYRHYSGGLPDLLLVRALYMSNNDCRSTSSDRTVGDLVDLGDWVGEEFSSEHQEAIRAQQVSRMFTDTDGDFLGCSKVGDSGGRATNRFHQSGRTRYSCGVNNNMGKPDDSSNNEEQNNSYLMPERLSLSHNSLQIRVECMFVEVKSKNDRLDSRQEDWLNILDQHGNARVCKFEKALKTRQKQP